MDGARSYVEQMFPLPALKKKPSSSRSSGQSTLIHLYDARGDSPVGFSIDTQESQGLHRQNACLLETRCGTSPQYWDHHHLESPELPSERQAQHVMVKCLAQPSRAAEAGFHPTAVGTLLHQCSYTVIWGGNILVQNRVPTCQEYNRRVIVSPQIATSTEG